MLSWSTFAFIISYTAALEMERMVQAHISCTLRNEEGHFYRVLLVSL